ncbi:hypothetical protein QIA34_06715 (plasmid) [Borreliella yangtzensis]|uniref:Uncharacterized protein n=1 Tax=Borreliella yangtzensis TaxID=683292 RepID=A0ABR6PBL8_9SPIR|nr:hypothetical protein [Borreliella yangtzensis]
MIILSILFLLISNVFVFSNEESEEVVIINESNRSDLGIILTSKTKFGSFVLRHHRAGHIDLDFNIQIINSSEILLKKIYINGVSVMEHPINTYFIDGINHFNFGMDLFFEGEKVNMLRKLAETNGIDVYIECFDEINNEKKKYSFKVSRGNSMHFYSAFDMIFHQ